jgi:hypothetical protein
MHYWVSEAKLSKDQTTVVTTSPKYNWSAPDLKRLLDRHVTLPPHPQIRIVGKHNSSVDFDIKLSMLRYITRSAADGPSWNYVRIAGDSELAFRGGKVENTVPIVKGGLEEWVNRFVAEESKEKRYATFSRVLAPQCHHARPLLVSRLTR